jgi:HSP20 family protein
MKIIRRDDKNEAKPIRVDERDPFSVFDAIDRTFDDLRNEIESLFWGYPAYAQYRDMKRDDIGARMPYADIIDRGDSIVVTAEMPGIPKENVEIEVDENGVEISGKVEQSVEDEDRGYYRRERAYSSFYRYIPLPEEIKPEDVRATMKNGVLEIVLPKKKPTKVEKKRKVKVE